MYQVYGFIGVFRSLARGWGWFKSLWTWPDSSRWQRPRAAGWR